MERRYGQGKKCYLPAIYGKLPGQVVVTDLYG